MLHNAYFMLAADGPTHPHLFFLLIPQPPRSTLFPYTTLFRSQEQIPRERYKKGDTIRAVIKEVVRNLTGTPEIIIDRKSTRLNSSHSSISYAVFCLKKKKKPARHMPSTRTVIAPRLPLMHPPC